MYVYTYALVKASCLPVFKVICSNWCLVLISSGIRWLGVNLSIAQTMNELKVEENIFHAPQNLLLKYVILFPKWKESKNVSP